MSFINNLQTFYKQITENNKMKYIYLYNIAIIAMTKLTRKIFGLNLLPKKNSDKINQIKYLYLIPLTSGITFVKSCQKIS